MLNKKQIIERIEKLEKENQFLKSEINKDRVWMKMLHDHLFPPVTKDEPPPPPPPPPSVIG